MRPECGSDQRMNAHYAIFGRRFVPAGQILKSWLLSAEGRAAGTRDMNCPAADPVCGRTT